jgi:nucleoside-diphosphate-sugar epimerase
MSSVLVTGAAGFIGATLTRQLLTQGHEVTCLVRKTSRLERLAGLETTLAYGDILDRESLIAPVANASVIYHVAGCIGAGKAEEYYRVNEQGVRNVFEAASKRSNPPVVVTVSSLAAAGPSPRGRLRVNGDPICPVSHYGRSKRAGERVAEEFANRVPVTVVRPCIVFGESDRGGLDLFRSITISRIHFVPGYLPNRFSLVHAADLVEWLIRAADRGKRLAPPSAGVDGGSPPAGYYFAAAPEYPTYYEFGQMLGQALGVRTLSMPWATPVVWVIGTFNEMVARWTGRPAKLGLDKVREATAGTWACSPQSTIDELGYAPAASLQERLNQTAAWYRREGWL